MKNPKKIPLTTSEFDYHLPQKLIAQQPIKPRDQARLLILDKKTGKIIHRHFSDLAEFLKAGDVLVFNDSKVIPARLWGRKETGGRIEIFLLQKRRGNIWQVMIGGKLGTASKVYFKDKISGQIIKKFDEKSWLIKFNVGQKRLFSIGETPLPHYIKKSAKLADYQTVYAKHEGSVAAPTAGLHFTKKSLSKIKSQGVEIEYVTLHVGLGTFAPVKTENILEHKMHAELGVLDKETAERLNKAKKEKRRIIAVGTTSVRILEAASGKNGRLKPINKWINIFIYPGYKFRFIDAMVTNFHLPKSTLLMLVCAFGGRSQIIKAYQKAIKKKYKFYSFGDGIMIK